jgi:hypothetical protein
LMTALSTRKRETRRGSGGVGWPWEGREKEGSGGWELERWRAGIEGGMSGIGSRRAREKGQSGGGDEW